MNKTIITISLLFFGTFSFCQTTPKPSKDFTKFSYKDWDSFFDTYKPEDRIEGLWEVNSTTEVIGYEKGDTTRIEAIVLHEGVLQHFVVNKGSKHSYNLINLGDRNYKMDFGEDYLNKSGCESTGFLQYDFFSFESRYEMACDYDEQLPSIKAIQTDQAKLIKGSSQFSYYPMSQGSGFLFNSDGYIITNAHVVSMYGAVSYKVSFPNINSISKEYLKAELIDVSYELDLAILKIDVSKLNQSNFPKIKFNQNQSLGDKVYVLGYPLESKLGSGIKLTDGLVSGENGFKNNIRSFQINAAINSGNSGGPIFNNFGQIIGVAFSVIGNAENVGFGIKSKFILKYLDEKRIGYSLDSTTNASFLSRISELKKNVVIVKAYTFD